MNKHKAQAAGKNLIMPADQKNDDQPLGAYKKITNTHRGVYSGYGRVTPIVYEPISGTIIVVQNSTAQSTPVTGILNLFYSTNGGDNWATREAWKQAGMIPVLPSIGIFNINGVTGINEMLNQLVYRISAAYVKWNAGTQQFDWSGQMNFIHFEDNEGGVLEFKGPNQNYQFWESPILVSENEDNLWFASATMPSPNDGFQYGAYSLSVFDYEQQTIDNYMPSAWGLDKFRTSTELNSSYNNYPYIDSDPEGTMYAAFNNFLANNETDRLVTVSKSTDKGKTWSELEQMPRSVLDNYVTDQGGITSPSNRVPFFLAYSQDAFIVTGVDEFSYVARLLFYRSDDNADFVLQIVEVYKKGGSWGMNKISEFENYNMFVIADEDPSDAVKDSLQSNRFDNEIQLCKTLTDNRLVVKWIDAVEDQQLAYNPPINLQGNSGTGGVIDTIYSNDVFASSRELNGDGGWIPRINQTKDANYHKMTFIPRLAPDAAHVPMITYQTAALAQDDPRAASYPEPIKQMLIDEFQGIFFTNVVAIPSDAEENTATYNFSLNDVTPNPATGVVEISFNIGSYGHAALEVYNALGQKVVTLQNGNLPSGFHAANLNTDNLTTGVYYFTLTVGGKSLTKTLTVVH